jgi:hypothetical protein
MMASIVTNVLILSSLKIANAYLEFNKKKLKWNTNKLIC